MKMLIVMGMRDRSLHHYMYPLTKLDEISKIYVVRKDKGPSIEKVKYITPKFLNNISIINFIIRFYLIIYSIIRYKPDIIHSYLLKPHGLMSLPIGKLFRKKVGISLIGGPVEIISFKGNPININYELFNENFSYNPNRFLLWLLNRFDYITVTGSFTKKYLISNSINKKKIFIMGRISPKYFDNNFKNIKNTSFVKEYDLLFVGRLIPLKRIDKIIWTTYLLKTLYPSIKLAIVGDGPEMNSLIKLVDELDLRNNVEFTGNITEVWNYYSKSKIFFIASEREGFPYTVCEAMTFKLPIVSSYCGDISDIIINGKNGIIKKGIFDEHYYSNKLIILLNNKKLYKEYQENIEGTIKCLNEKGVIIMWKDIINMVS